MRATLMLVGLLLALAPAGAPDSAPPERRVEGTALVEGRADTPAGLQLEADGRLLRVTDKTQLLPPPRKELEPVADLASLRSGVFLRYRGRTTPDGFVEVDELSAWVNLLEEKEKELYEKYAPEIALPLTPGAPSILKLDVNRYELSPDPELQLYLDRLAGTLLPDYWRAPARAADAGVRFWFQPVVHRTPQASAFPGGAVVVHTELWRLAENEAQLAFALAHEIAHVTQEHAWRQFAYHRNKLRAVRWGTAGLGYLVESAIRRGYQRDLEGQADRLALAYMVRAGYDPREALPFLRRLDEARLRLPALVWHTHRSHAARRQALLDELVLFSARDLDHESLRKDSPAFAALRETIPAREPDDTRPPRAR